MRRLVTYLFVSFCVIIGLSSGMVAFLLTHQWVDLSAIEHLPTRTPTILLDDRGQEWGRFQLDKREAIPLALAPQNLIQAFIATEDHTFFEHYGLSVRGILRSLTINLVRGRKAQGASTITQQLVRLLFLNNARTFTRKFKEQFLSIVVEYQYTKEQILEAYLNQVYFGGGIYGVQAASLRFWGIPVTKLEPHQSALLAAIMRAPHHYNPLYNEKAALERRNLVLKLMYQRGFLTKEQLAEQLEKPLGIISKKEPIAPHLKEAIRQILEEKYGRETVYTGGLVVQTTLNRHAQRNAEKVFTEHLTHLATIDAELEGALVCLDNQTAGVKALVGGRDFSPESQFNRALQARRQMGSTIKPIICSCFIEEGGTLGQTRIDEPLEASSTWQPHNVQEKFEGTISIAHALITSNNIIFVKLFMELGAPQIIDCAQRFHLPGPLYPYPSLALGCTECTPLQAAGTYCTFANKGVYQDPYFIEWVKDKYGKKIWKHTPVKSRVISWEVCSQVLQGLKLVGNHIHSRIGRWIAGEGAGKTGTTNEHRTCWFIGLTPTHTTAIYLGRDDNKALKNKIFSTWHVCPIWIDFNRTIERPKSSFFFDPSLDTVWINEISGIEVHPDAPGAIPILKPR